MLTHFASIIRKKYPDPSLNVSITQFAESKVKLDVRTDEGDLIDSIPGDLEDYIGSFFFNSGVEKLTQSESDALLLDQKFNHFREELTETLRINNPTHYTNNAWDSFIKEFANDFFEAIKEKDMGNKNINVYGTYIEKNKGIVTSQNYYDLSNEPEKLSVFLDKKYEEHVVTGLTKEDAIATVGNELKEAAESDKGFKKRLVELGNKFTDSAVSETAKAIIKAAIENWPT